MQIDNPLLTSEAVLEIKNKVQNNTATAKDYETLDTFLSAISLGGYILKQMRLNGFPTYQSFINDSSKKDNFSRSYIYGAITEAISQLQNFLVENNL